MEAVTVMTRAIKQIGDAFARGDCWLPELVGGGAALQKAMNILEEEFKKTRKTTRKFRASCYWDRIGRHTQYREKPRGVFTYGQWF